MKRFIAAFLLLVCSGMAFGQDAFQQSEAIDQAAAAQEAQKAQAINDQIPDYQVVGGQVNQNTFGELKSDYRARLLAAHEVYGTPKPACMGVILDDCNYDGPVLNDIANDPELIQKILDRDKVNNAKWAAEKVTRDAQEAAEQKVQAAKDAQAAAEQAAYSAAHPPLSGGGILFWLIFWFVAYWLPSIMATARGHAERRRIAGLNFIAGWTIIGWILLLVWACNPNRGQAVVPAQRRGGFITGMVAFLVLVCSMTAFGQSVTMLDGRGQKSEGILISSHAPISALIRRDEMLSPGRWTPAATPSGINLNAMGKTYMAFTDIHNTYENAFKSGGCGGGIPFSGEINWNSCMFQVHLITYLDKPMPDGTVTITSAQAFSLGFAMDDTPNLPFNSMIPLAFTGRNAAGQTTFKDRSNYSLIMEGMGARSDLSRPENDAKRQIAARVRDVLVAHERDWHTSSEPIQSYPGANQQAEAVRKMIQQTMSPDTCNGCGVVHVGQAPAQVEVPPPPVPTISATTARLREAKQVAETARATVEQDTEQLAHSQSRMEAVLAEGTVPPAVQLRLRAHLEEVMIGPQRTTLTLAQANAAAAEQGYEKAKAEAQAAVAPGAPATTLTALYHVGGDVTPPQLIYAPDPEFSGEARRAMLPKGWLGVVVVSLIVDEQGYPQRVVVVRHQGMGLDEKAVEAVKQYRFKPAMLQGVPVSVEVNIEVNFKIY